MAIQNHSFSRIEHPREVNEFLETLFQPGVAFLVLGNRKDLPLSVVLKEVTDDNKLCLDISGMREHAPALCRGQPFRISGLGDDGLVRTPELKADKCWEEQQRLFCLCDMPQYLENLQRRDTFRARLKRYMPVRVHMTGATGTASGRLLDLSLHGCLVELHVTDAAILDNPDKPLQLSMVFPDKSTHDFAAWPRHQTTDDDYVQCGFMFDGGAPDQQEELMLLVREIEREAARNAASGRRGLWPSPLFQAAEDD